MMTQQSPDDIRREVAALGPWFHNIDLRGVPTAPNHFLGDFPSVKWRAFAHFIPQDLSEKSVLDIGCNGGFYSLAMKRRGAKRVLGIDFDETYLAQARYAARVSELDIEFRHLSVYDVAALRERFDIVLFMGVLYHLRHPLLALDLIREHVAQDLVIFQSLLRGSEDVPRIEKDYDFDDTAPFELEGYPKLHFVERKYAADPTNWWIPNRACAEGMLRSAGFEIRECSGDIYLCRPVAVPEGAGPVYPARGGRP
jgi:tRNA (mo5U34)-methyltransferase